MASFTFILLAASLLVSTSAAPQNTKLSIRIPEECKGKGFCSIRPEGYDKIEARINKLLPLHLIDIGMRSSEGHVWESSDDDDNCPSKTSLQSVYIHDDPKGTKMDIIVQTNLFPQKITEVTCNHNNNKGYQNLKEGGWQCFRTLGYSNFNMYSRCEQSYATRNLWVYDPEEDKIKSHNYTVPVCCSCVIRKK